MTIDGGDDDDVVCLFFTSFLIIPPPERRTGLVFWEMKELYSSGPTRFGSQWTASPRWLAAWMEYFSWLTSLSFSDSHCLLVPPAAIWLPLPPRRRLRTAENICVNRSSTLCCDCCRCPPVGQPSPSCLKQLLNQALCLSLSTSTCTVCVLHQSWSLVLRIITATQYSTIMYTIILILYCLYLNQAYYTMYFKSDLHRFSTNRRTRMKHNDREKSSSWLQKATFHRAEYSWQRASSRLPTTSCKREAEATYVEKMRPNKPPSRLTCTLYV